ncbi:hypothetical protein Tco_1072972, partial [Tanacetum coccineum]
MNLRYNVLFDFNTRLQEKNKINENKDLRSLCDASSNEVKKLKDQLAEAEAAARSADELARTDAKLDVATTIEHHFDDLRSEVTRFVSSGVDGLVQKLLSSDEFNSTLAHILSFGITFGVERGLRMGRTDAEFEEASQNVFNFFLRGEAEFNKAVAALPSTHFPFLAKIAEAAESVPSKVA